MSHSEMKYPSVQLVPHLDFPSLSDRPNYAMGNLAELLRRNNNNMQTVAHLYVQEIRNFLLSHTKNQKKTILKRKLII